MTDAFKKYHYTKHYLIQPMDGPNPAGLTLFVLGLGIGLEAHILGVGIRQITCGTYIQSQQFGSATPRARTPPDVVYMNTFRSFFLN